MIIVFLGTPIILMILYLIVAYRTMKNIQITNTTGKKRKKHCRFGSSIRTYKNVEDYYTIRNSLNYP